MQERCFIGFFLCRNTIKATAFVDFIFNLLFHVNPFSMPNGSFLAGNLQLKACWSLIIAEHVEWRLFFKSINIEIMVSLN